MHPKWASARADAHFNNQYVNIFHKTLAVLLFFVSNWFTVFYKRLLFELSKLGVSSLQSRSFKAVNSDFQACKLRVSTACSQIQSKMYGFFKLTLLRCCSVAVYFLFVLIIKILTVILTASLQRSTNCCTKTFSEKYREVMSWLYKICPFSIRNVSNRKCSHEH